MTHPIMPPENVQFQPPGNPSTNQNPPHTRQNHQNHISSVKQTASNTGQRILSMPSNGNNKTAQNSASEEPTDKESSPEPEEFIEIKSDLPTVERLDNSKMIRELKIGKKRRKELLEYD